MGIEKSLKCMLAPIPSDESERQQALDSFAILDTLAETEFDDITRLASAICDTPMSAVSLIDHRRQWFKSTVGIPVSETSRDISFCGHAIHSSEIVEIPNTLNDDRFADNPLVNDGLRIRFYAGAPLVTSDGYKIGTLCVIDTRPKKLSDTQIESMKVLSRSVMQLLELRKKKVEIATAVRFYRLTHDLICTVSADGFLLTLNPVWQKTLGWIEDEFRTRRFLEFVHPDDMERTQKEIAKLRTGKQARHFILRFQHKNGNYHSLSWSADFEPLGDQFIASARDVTEELKAQTKLAEREQELESILSNMQEGLVVRDRFGKIMRANSTAHVMLGLERSQLLEDRGPQHRAQRIILADGTTVPEGELPFELAFRTGKPQLQIPLGIHYENQNPIWLLVNSVPVIRQGAERPTSVITTFSDFTALQNAQLKMQELVRAKSDFLSTMSHEIRTPLNAIIGMTNLSLDTQLSREQREYLQIVKVSSDALLAIVNDILDFSKIEAGKIELESLPYRLRPFMDDCQKVFSNALAQKGLSLHVGIPREVPEGLLGDRARIQQILFNLISNAIKFTPQGEIHVRLSVVATSRGERLLRFEIQDSGIGIAPELRSHIFGAFNQADKTISRKFGGTGLGLSISKRLIELMQGSIGVESQAGIGSTFWFEIPLTQAVAPLNSHANLPKVRSLQGRILLVEDNLFNQKIAVKTLEKFGYTIQTANNGKEALITLIGDTFDLILMDCQMPQMDGYEATRAIRRLDSSSDIRSIPIIAMTANALEGDRRQCIDAGMNDYVSKPVDFQDLINKIETLKMVKN